MQQPLELLSQLFHYGLLSLINKIKCPQIFEYLSYNFYHRIVLQASVLAPEHVVLQ
jgi:hypothetical protein